MRRRVALAVVAVAALAFAVGSGGFSSVTADRTASVEVVGDEDAYMALNYSDSQVELSGSSEYDDTFVTATNQFAQPVNFTIEYDVSTDEGLSASPASDTVTSQSVGVGNERDVTVQFNCTGSGQQNATVEFGARAEGASVFAETTENRTVEYQVDCSSAA
ncbi:hypothetical protein [Haloarcula nitratireducens]|uniref:DUF1102 domain-containing protein n=1 Tax=Haloarcula nitratireducens TaxID=2487749 RepID=A0AAW4PBP1_9EURY|nr:hypothetical protein [Halomicroarcula nitratireducens]MBX0295306.1 hypothetical protein [Halomicroarcula nitratireducens]